MRIGIFYKHFLHGGGYPREWRTYARELAQLGLQVFIYSWTGECDKELMHHNIQLRVYYGSESSSFKVPSKLIRDIKTHADSLDIMEVVGGFFPENITVCKTLFRSGTPYVYAPLGDLVPNVLKKSRMKKKIFIELCLKRVLDRAVAIHCHSSFERKHINKYTNSKTFIAGLGCFYEDLPKRVNVDFWGEKVPSFRDKFIMLYLGRLDYYGKGLDVLMESFNVIYKNNNKVRLVLVGPDELCATKIISERINEYGLSGKIRLFDRMCSPDKFHALASADLLVYPSRMDILPRTVREAISVGCPVMVTEETQMSDIVTENEIGFVCKLDCNDICPKVLDFIASHKSRKFDKAKLELSWTNQTQQLLDGYNSCV